jgi:hypothetical protein
MKEAPRTAAIQLVMRRDLDDAELVVGDGGTEFSSQATWPRRCRRAELALVVFGVAVTGSAA